jgi:Dolichyl-phosphate-mannose-protein mannosyltransferase
VRAAAGSDVARAALRSGPARGIPASRAAAATHGSDAAGTASPTSSLPGPGVPASLLSPPSATRPPGPAVAPSQVRPTTRNGALARLRSMELRDAVLPTLLVHSGLLAFAPIAVSIFGSDQARALGPLAIWNHWDGPHLLEVAAHGYDPTGDPARSVLFPLYPLLIRLGSFLLDPLVAAMSISFVATILAAVGLYRLVRPVSGRVIARNSVLALNIFPTAFFLVAPYTEATFVAFAIWAFVAARDERWGSAGVLGLLAALTRVEGAFLLPALAVDYLVRRRRRLELDGLRLGVIALGPLIYLAINAYAYGSPFFFLDIQRRVFGVRTVAPWDMFGPLVRSVFAGGSGETWITVYVAPLAAFVLLAAVAAWGLRSRHSSASHATLTWVNLLSLATLSWPISVPRYLLDIFPVFIAGGAIGRLRGAGTALASVSLLLLGAFTTLFVMGHWAF